MQRRKTKQKNRRMRDKEVVLSPMPSRVLLEDASALFWGHSEGPNMPQEVGKSLI